MVDRLKKPCYADPVLPISHDALIKHAVIRVECSREQPSANPGLSKRRISRRMCTDELPVFIADEFLGF